MKNLWMVLLLSTIIFTGYISLSKKDAKKAISENEKGAFMPSFDLAKSTLTWTAFKNPTKVGVSGTFKDISIKKNKFSIKTKSVSSGNEVRDGKLAEFFFANLIGDKITGKYGQVENNKIPVTIKMNGVEKTFSFDYMENDTASIVKGKIDIISDFGGNKALTGIHEACKELHLGKTWSDVTLQVVTKK